MRCVLITPVSDIQAREIASTIRTYVDAGSPRPPYSSGIVAREEAELAHLLHHLVRVAVGVLELDDLRQHLAGQPGLEGLEHGVFVGGGHVVLPCVGCPRTVRAGTVRQRSSAVLRGGP